MNERIKKLYQEAGELHKQATDILNEFGDKPMPADKSTQVDRLFDDMDAKIAEAKGLEEQAQRQARGVAAGRDLAEPTNRLGAGQTPAAQKDTSPEAEFQMKAFLKAVKGGEKSLSQAELKALQASDDPSGGYLTVPQQMVNGIIQFVNDAVFVRQLATVYQVPTAQSLGAAALDTDLSDPDWTSELATGNADAIAPFGKRELHPNPLAKRILISRKLLRQAPNVEAIVRERLGYKFAVAQEKGFLTGHGAGQPLGLFTASTDGISTARDVTAANATTVVPDDFVNAFYTMKPQYMARGQWLLHRDVVKMLRKVKDGDGSYIWQPGLTGGQPSTILDRPFFMSEYAPNTLTSGKYVALFGDFSFYWVADSLNMEMQVLTELYALTNQNAYIGRMETDGMPVLEEAFVRVKLA